MQQEYAKQLVKYVKTQTDCNMHDTVQSIKEELELRRIAAD